MKAYGSFSPETFETCSHLLQCLDEQNYLLVFPLSLSLMSTPPSRSEYHVTPPWPGDM
ncbi:MAG: hypothetical protein WAP07_02105 [Acutalibacteraceae bacterium]